jgi:hypothetical protein
MEFFLVPRRGRLLEGDARFPRNELDHISIGRFKKSTIERLPISRRCDSLIGEMITFRTNKQKPDLDADAVARWGKTYHSELGRFPRSRSQQGIAPGVSAVCQFSMNQAMSYNINHLIRIRTLRGTWIRELNPVKWRHWGWTAIRPSDCG